MGIAMIDEANKWRLETPGHDGWQRTARPDDPNRYLMISCDCHANEPANLWHQRLDEKYRSRLPRFEVDEKGVKWMVSDGLRRSRSRARLPTRQSNCERFVSTHGPGHG